MPQPTASHQNWEACLGTVRPALLLAPRTYLDDVRNRLADEGVQSAVARHDTGAIYDWIIRLLDRQGISNAAAIAFAERHGNARWVEVGFALAPRPVCAKLRSHWHFDDCGYRKSVRTCRSPALLDFCPVPSLPARKGSLNQAAFGLALFIRDVCGSDFVGWIDDRLAAADLGLEESDRDTIMRDTMLEPLVNIPGTGSKVWSMILAELLLGADPDRERWVTTGASFIAIDSLVHAHLHRTGILRRLAAMHPYGALCYERGGCADIIAALARRVDARDFDKNFPAYFPRWVQFGLWRFCAEGGWSICNANKIADSVACQQTFCPAFSTCDRLPLGA